MTPSDRTLRDTAPVAARTLWRGDEGFRHLVESVTDYAIFLLDAEGRVATWNEGARRLKGYEAAEIVGQSFERFYPPDKVAARWPEKELAEARARGRFEDEGWRLRKDGSRFWANVVITALYDEDGVLRGFSKITRDLTERRTEAERLQRSEEHFRLLVEGVKDHAMYVLDPAGRVLTWNLGAVRIKGYAASDVVGTFFGRFYTPEDSRAGLPERALAIALADGSFEAEGWRIRKDGSRFWAHVTITALRDRSGAHVGFAKVTRDLTQRLQVEELEDARRRMDEFVAMLAHELRNPLAPIRNALEILRDPQDASDAAWSQEVITRQVGHLTRLVDDLLDVSRISTGKISLRRDPVRLDSVIARAVEAAEPLIRQREHVLTVRADPAPIVVRGDETRLAQVVINLLNNAAKYTKPGGHITVSASSDRGLAVLRVADDGIGMTPELLARVFDMFAQGERSIDRSEGGLGIGLTLAKRLVELHGGTIAARSEGPGRGSEIAVWLPAIADAAVPQGLEPADRGAAAGGARRILVVDDDRDSADSMAMLLRRRGHTVRTAYDGASAIAAADDLRPGVVLLDLGLPRMDGFEVAERLRARPSCARTLLVAMTGYGQPDDRIRTREAGFAHHLVKPLDAEMIDAVLDAAR